jgi:hypothetical protein
MKSAFSRLESAQHSDTLISSKQEAVVRGWSDGEIRFDREFDSTQTTRLSYASNA